MKLEEAYLKYKFQILQEECNARCDDGDDVSDVRDYATKMVKRLLKINLWPSLLTQRPRILAQMKPVWMNAKVNMVGRGANNEYIFHTDKGRFFMNDSVLSKLCPEHNYSMLISAEFPKIVAVLEEDRATILPSPKYSKR
jgi:hypothetical protein